MIEKQPNDDAAFHHDVLAPKGHEERGRLTSSKLSIAGCNGGGADSQHPHLFHLGAASASTYECGQLQGVIADNWSVLASQQASVSLGRFEPGGSTNTEA